MQLGDLLLQFGQVTVQAIGFALVTLLFGLLQLVVKRGVLSQRMNEADHVHVVYQWVPDSVEKRTAVDPLFILDEQEVLAWGWTWRDIDQFACRITPGAVGLGLKEQPARFGNSPAVDLLSAIFGDVLSND